MPSANITVAIAGMAPRADRPAATRGQALRRRFISAAILLPLAIAGGWLGGFYWDALVFLFGIVMAWEWAGMCARGDPRACHRASGANFGIGPAALASILSVGVAVLAAAFDRYVPALALLCLGAALAAAIGSALPGRRGGWYGFGILYVGLPSIAIMWVRAQHEGGLATLFWMLALVVAVDTGAFAAGRLIGGPKLAPRVSPNKTWAGLGGGVAAAMLIGWVAASWFGLPGQWPLILISATMAMVEQGGDLAESAFKRHFGVKDSSQLIPGHGGVLDRVDGLLAVSLAVALAELFGGGILAWTR